MPARTLPTSARRHGFQHLVEVTEAMRAANQLTAPARWALITTGPGIVVVCPAARGAHFGT